MIFGFGKPGLQAENSITFYEYPENKYNAGSQLLVYNPAKIGSSCTGSSGTGGQTG